MALKIAKFYKGLVVDVNKSDGHVAILPAKNEALTVKVKCDNFATRIDITWTDQASPFDYKYVTFDDNALFEITDCIGNENLYSFFIEYRTNIKLDGTIDTSFYFNGVTPHNLSACRFTGQDFSEILGDIFTVSEMPLSPVESAFIWAVKIRLSELPQNVNKCISGYGEWTTIQGEPQGKYGNRIFNPSPRNLNAVPSSGKDFLGIDNAVTVILPIPSFNKQSRLTVTTGGNSYTFELDAVKFRETLTALISDLTLSVEIMPLASNSLYIFDDRYDTDPTKFHSIAVFETVNLLNITVPCAVEQRNSIAGNNIRGVGTLDTPPYPFFVCDRNVSGGIWECRRGIALNYFTTQTQAAFALNILGSRVDLHDSKNATNVILQSKNGGIRVWTNYKQHSYIDISTTLEYAKSAYSNFDAFTKSNINLISAQKEEQLKLTQQQRKNMLAFSLGRSAASTVAGTVAAAATGNYVGAAMTAASGLFDTLTAGVQDNLTAQNEIANLKLQHQQALQAARATIVTSSDLIGSVTLDTIQTLNSAEILIAVEYVELTTLHQQTKIYNALIERDIIENSNATDAYTPAWLSNVSSYYNIELYTIAKNTRKGVVLYGKVNYV